MLISISILIVHVNLVRIEVIEVMASDNTRVQQYSVADVLEHSSTIVQHCSRRNYRSISETPDIQI